MQPLEIVAVRYAIDRVNKIYGLNLVHDPILLNEPKMFFIGAVAHSYITGKPIRLAGKEVKVEGTCIVVGDLKYETFTNEEKSRIHGYIIQTLDGASLPSFAAVTLACGAAKNVMDNPGAMLNLVADIYAAKDAADREIAELTGRVKLLSVTKE